MSEISVIVPVYNVEEYISECIESIICQTYSNIEIILIDDGSDDKSGKICDQYKERDNRIRVIHKSNEGVGLARKKGIELAKSPYIVFLDSDDYYDLSFCEEMLFTIKSENADMVECGYKIFSVKNSFNHIKYNDFTIFDRAEFKKNIIESTIVNGNEAIVVWNKIYKTDYIKKFVSNYGTNLLEDYIFNLQYYQNLMKYVYIPKCLVNYRKVENSLSRKCDPNTYEVLLEVDKMKNNILKKIYKSKTDYEEKSVIWFLNYTKNFLESYILSGAKKKEIMHILNDKEFIKKCKIVNEYSLFEKLIANKKMNIAYYNLYLKTRMTLCKMYGSKIKSKLNMEVKNG